MCAARVLVDWRHLAVDVKSCSPSSDTTLGGAVSRVKTLGFEPIPAVVAFNFVELALVLLFPSEPSVHL